MLSALELNGPTLLAMAPFAMIAICAIAYYAYKVFKVRADNDLKQAMIERGMSAEEIERVMRIGKAKE